MFTLMFDGLRSYYLGFDSRRKSAGFHAAATLSFITCVAVASAIPILEYAVYGSLTRSDYLFSQKPLLLLMGLAIGYGHVLLAKRTGRYDSKERSAPLHWKRYLVAYGAGSLALLGAAACVAVLAPRAA